MFTIEKLEDQIEVIFLSEIGVRLEMQVPWTFFQDYILKSELPLLKEIDEEDGGQYIDYAGMLEVVERDWTEIKKFLLYSLSHYLK